MVLDWYNDRLQLLSYDGKSEEVAVSVRLNQDGGVAEIVIRDELLKLVRSDNGPRSEWAIERDDRTAHGDTAFKLETALHQTSVLHVRVPVKLQELFEQQIRCVMPYGSPCSLRDGISVSGDLLADGFCHKPPQDPVRRFVKQCTDLDDQPDEFFFHR